MKAQQLKSKRKYSRASYDNRLELIKMVQEQGQTIKNSAKLLNIKESTAKLIISRFRTSGTIYETKKDLTIRCAKQEQLHTSKTDKMEQNPQILIKIEPQTLKDQSKHKVNACIPSSVANFSSLHLPQMQIYYHFMPPIYYPL